MVRPPCYDPIAKTDCPYRSMNCHSTCIAWQQYEKEKRELYQQRNTEKIRTFTQVDYILRSVDRLKRRRK